MINNRQNGRRRGRGGGAGGAPRPNGGGGSGGQDRGNRIDNRARGNAAQLHEKYKALARDAQMQGDRVNTEYYLQFADHYFRVLAESRSRFEDQQPRPRRDDFSQSDEDYADEGERMGSDDQGSLDQGDGDDQPRYESRDRNERQGGDRQGNDRPNGDRQNGDRPNGNRDEQRRPRREREPRYEAQAPVEEGEANGNVGNDAGDGIESAPRRRGRPARSEAATEPADTIDLDRLPPSFSMAPPVNDADGDDEGEKPRRRTRKPRGEEAAA